jgi:uncharacterized membrane protein YgaE (UPF0421/DUF939 family)
MAAACARALRRLAAHAWPLVQSTAAATAAWIIAGRVGGRPNPFFAPIAALVALTASRGERGSTAVRLLIGVVVGIVSGELAISVLGSGYSSLALATFAATAVAVALGSARIVIVQAGASAVLTVALADSQAGPWRLVDALIGAGVALVFSQVLFPPEPVALLRRAEAAALEDMADGLELTAGALERDDEELAERALSRLRDLRDRLVELSRTRRASSRVVRHSLIWRTRMAPVVRESEHAGHLDLLGGSCLLLTRTALAMSRLERRRLAPAVQELAAAIMELARAPDDRSSRQRAADRAVDLVRWDAGSPAQFPQALVASAAIRMVAMDVMVLAGLDPAQVADAVRGGGGELQVPDPPPAPRMPFHSNRRRPTR